MKKLLFFFLMFVCLVAAQANDMEAKKYYKLGLVSTITSKKIDYFTEALRLNPALAEAYEKRGLLYYFQEKYDAVIQDFQKYIELAPAKAEDFRLLGLGFLRSRNYSQAIDNFSRALEIDPKNTKAYVNRAEAYRLRGQYEDAICDATRAIEIWGDPDTMSESYKIRYKIYWELNQKNKAYADLASAWEIDPKVWKIDSRLSGSGYGPLLHLCIMGLFILNATVFFFIFELRPGLLKIGRYSRLNILNSKLLAPQSDDTINKQILHPLFAEIEKLQVTLKDSQKIIFSYLDENIYNLMTDEKKEFLVKTSIFPRMNAGFCDQLLNIRHSRDILKDLEASHLVAVSFDNANKWYTYHQLIRDYLQKKLVSEIGSETVLELYKKADGLLESFDEGEEAVFSYSNEASFLRVWHFLNKAEREAGVPLKLLPKPDNLVISDVFFDDRNVTQEVRTPYLKVYFFGKFKIFQGDEEIPDTRWKSKKALMIFKYLLFSREKGYLKKDVLMELLWPEDDPVKTAKRFHVALTSLRKTLEPEISRGASSAYISRSGDAYLIDIGDKGWVDIENFKKELRLGQKAKDAQASIEHFLKAERLYRGNFLEEDLYVQWCDAEREKFKEEYLQLLEEIMHYYKSKKDYKQCIDYAKKFLSIDKYAENIYQLLMLCYSRTGNKAMITKVFKKCKDSLMSELDCPLSRETEILYQELTSN